MRIIIRTYATGHSRPDEASGGKGFFLNISRAIMRRPHKRRPFLRRRYQLREKKNKNKNFRKLLCHSRKIPSLHSPSSSLCFRFFPPPQWAPLAGAQTPLKEPRLWELACSGKRGELRCVYAEASFPAHPLFRDWPPARGPHHPLLSL